MFIKRAKSRPSLRAREADDESTSTSSPLGQSSFTPNDTLVAPSPIGSTSVEIEENESGSIMERKKAKGKERRKVGGGPVNRLSFGGDAEAGEEGGFKPRKSLLSQSIKLGSTSSDLENGSASGSAETPSSKSIYSREDLSQLKASTPTRAPKATVENEDEIRDGRLSGTTKDKYASMLTEDTTAGIPDDAAIASAKMRRQAAVENVKHNGGLGDGEDYIALGGGSIVVNDGREGPHPESRLMREEDEEGEGDEGKSGLD
jgi:GC-rich sequence DNA-binding factor